MKRPQRIIIFLLVALGVNLIFQSNYYAVRPGKVEDLSSMIQVEDPRPEENLGSFNLVTVAQQRATLLVGLRSLFDPAVELIPRWQVIPRGIEMEEYNRIMRMWMVNSQTTAKVIALRHLGYPVDLETQGIYVSGIIEGSPTQGILEPGDIILELDGEGLTLAEDLVDGVKSREIGSLVNLTIKRDGEIFNREFKTVPHTREKNKSGLGIYITDQNLDPQFPLDINIDTRAITGPSGGLMFVLEIINQLEARDLSRGYKIAGSGTINLDEQVGSIGSIKQKVAAAEGEGVDIFFVPGENLADARKAVKNMTLVEVNSLPEALAYLDSMSSTTLPFPGSTNEKAWAGILDNKSYNLL